MFKKIEINIPFVEAITQMPNYAKFLKDILSKKKKIVEEGIVSLTTTCSVVIQKSLPAKMKDLGSFTIPCSIGKYEFKEALCDSGVSINLMPLSVVQRLSLGELTPTTITLQMADRTTETIELRPDLKYEEEPVEILAREVKELRNKKILLVKVLWGNHKTEEATWESEETMRQQYPQLFN